MHLIFDLDGTLLDSIPGIESTLNHILSARGLPTHERAAVVGFIGSGSLELCRRAMPEGSPDSLSHELDQDFQRDYAHHWQSGSALYPGITKLIENLASDGHKLAVLSNKPDRFTREIVDYFFPDSPFDFVLGKSDRFPRKPAPNAVQYLLAEWATTHADTRFVGDSDVDRDTAAAAQVPFIGVSWGYHDATRLGPVVVESAEAITSLLR